MVDLKHMRSTKLLWLDLEMTGLDPEVHRIVEVGAVITDFSFHKLPGSEYQAVVSQSEEVLAQASEVAKQMDAQNGLHDQVRHHGKSESAVQHELAAIIREQFGDEPAVLAGNTIHQDRRFIRKWWPEVEALLHYRMLDVSAWKVYMNGKYGLEFSKQENHRALGDVDESIAELEYYLSWFAQHKTKLES